MGAYVASLAPGPEVPSEEAVDPTKGDAGPGWRAVPRQLRDVPQLRRCRRRPDPRQVRAAHRRRHRAGTSTRPWSPGRRACRSSTTPTSRPRASATSSPSSTPSTRQESPGGMTLGSLGPVSEGLFAWVFGLGSSSPPPSGSAPSPPSPHPSTPAHRRQIGIPMNEQDTTHLRQRGGPDRSRHRRAPRPGAHRRGRRHPRALHQPRAARSRPPGGRPRRGRRAPRREAGRDAVRHLDRRHAALHRPVLRSSTSRTTIFVPGIGVTSASNLALGVTLALALLGHRLRRGPLGQDADARRGDRRGAAPAAGHGRVPRPRRRRDEGRRRQLAADPAPDSSSTPSAAPSASSRCRSCSRWPGASARCPRRACR